MINSKNTGKIFTVGWRTFQISSGNNGGFDISVLPEKDTFSSLYWVCKFSETQIDLSDICLFEWLAALCLALSWFPFCFWSSTLWFLPLAVDVLRLVSCQKLDELLQFFFSAWPFLLNKQSRGLSGQECIYHWFISSSLIFLAFCFGFSTVMDYFLL